MPTTATTIRCSDLALPAALPGPPNPLPPLLPRPGTHRIGDRMPAGVPRDMARQLKYAPLDSMLPAPLRDGYHRARRTTALPAIVLENDRLRVTVLPGLGGRVHSLFHKPTGRDLVYRNPVLQPANFALNGAWFSGGIEWNIGATGHSTLSVAPLHAAQVPAPGGNGAMLRLWEWERLRDLPFQVDLWLPDGSDFLYVGVRVRNPHAHATPTYWWSNIAVPEERRVLVPAEEAWHYGYDRTLRLVPVPELDGTDRSYPLHSDHSNDFFYELPDGRRRWIAALDADGHGLVQTSTDLLRGRKLFVWGAGAGGRSWQRWLTEPGTGGYAEIQAGLARTQLEHLRMPPESELAWLEAYGPLSANPAASHGPDWSRACAEVTDRLAEVLPRTAVDDAYEEWRASADTEPDRRLATGSGWGALEVLRGRFTLPGTPFDEDTLGAEQEPWRHLLRVGALPAADLTWPQPGTLVAPPWRDMLETAPATPLTEYHLGIAQWHAGDRAQAVRSWERGLEVAGTRWPLLRCLAVADTVSDHPERAADRYDEAFDDLCARRPDGAGAADRSRWVAASAALGREAITALLAVGRAGRARAVWRRLDTEVRGRGRFRLLEAELLVAEGRPEEARAVFDEGFEVADLREGEETIGEVWRRITDEPLPPAYDFRMRPSA